MERTGWYKEAVVYQIYPLSFMDSDNDGMGDIPGIISRIDYLADLGITAIWFSPLYPSPWADYGYDISDYRNIHPAFGTMEDFDRLVAECHGRGIRVIMDMVLNHTSDEHEWFKSAVSDPESPYRDWYIIRKGRHKKVFGRDKLIPPTNWNATFTGPAWEQIPGTEDFYLHLFDKKQPDLNWENPEVRQEAAEILKFWMDKGVDGFRFDVFNLFSKVYPLEDDEAAGLLKGSKYFIDGPRIHEFLRELNENSLALYDSYTVGESYTPSEENAHKYVAESSHELDTIFDFAHLTCDNHVKYIPRPFSLRIFKEGLFGPQEKLYADAWNTLVLENHDNARSVSRFGIDTDKWRYEAATFLALVTFMGWGIPFIYQGEEIGMTNAEFKSLDEMKDPVTGFVYNTARRLGIPGAAAFRIIRGGARDHARTPMHWDGSANCGFNKGAEPWQCMGGSPDINTEADIASRRSIYRFYQELIKIKKSNKTAIYGRTKEYAHDDNKIIAYSRTVESDEAAKRLFVLGNFSDKYVEFDIPEDFAPTKLEVLLTNYEYTVTGRTMQLRPYEAILFEERR